MLNNSKAVWANNVFSNYCWSGILTLHFGDFSEEQRSRPYKFDDSWNGMKMIHGSLHLLIEIKVVHTVKNSY